MLLRRFAADFLRGRVPIGIVVNAIVLVCAGLGYLISPVDLLPEVVLGPIGLIDGNPCVPRATIVSHLVIFSP